jgi:hypothetical protein
VIVRGACGFVYVAPDACQPVLLSSCLYCAGATLVHSTATARWAPTHVSFGTACGTGTPDGSAPPCRKCPGTVAQVTGRTGEIAVSCRDDGAAPEADDGDDGAAFEGDAGPEETGGEPPAAPAPPDELHPPATRAASAPATSPARRKVT